MQDDLSPSPPENMERDLLDAIKFVEKYRFSRIGEDQVRLVRREDYGHAHGHAHDNLKVSERDHFYLISRVSKSVPSFVPTLETIEEEEEEEEVSSYGAGQASQKTWVNEWIQMKGKGHSKWRRCSRTLQLAVLYILFG